MIRLSGYDVPEKLEIAEKYLVPKSMVSSGLMVKESPEEIDPITDEDGAENEKPDKEKADAVFRLSEMVPASLSIERSALESLVRWYCREAGVRNLAKKIDKITGLLSLQKTCTNMLGNPSLHPTGCMRKILCLTV